VESGKINSTALFANVSGGEPQHLSGRKKVEQKKERGLNAPWEKLRL